MIFLDKQMFDEALYKVDDRYLIHLKENQHGCQYSVFDVESRKKTGDGLIPWTEIEDSAVKSTLAAFRLSVFEEMGMEGEKVAAVSLNMLRDFRDSDVRKRGLWEPETLPQRDIRFIDSHYKELFRILDGGCIQIHYPDETVVKPCKFIDEYHTQIGWSVYHICQFAEVMERCDAHFMPEPEIMGDVAAWQVGRDKMLAIQADDGGYDFTLLDDKYRELGGGRLNTPEISMIQARQEVLSSFGLEQRELRAMFHEDVMEKALAANAPTREDTAKKDTQKRESVLGKLKQATEVTAPAPTSKKHREPER